MKQAKWFLHPIFVFVLATIALAISLFLYIHWYVGVSENLKSIIRYYRLDGDQFFEAKTWVVILILSLLVGVILSGILIIFIYNLKTFQLYRLQQTFINNFTHELKTPVTSLKIYLETFTKYRLPRAEQLKYIGFMLQDTERLSCNINSILNLARIESHLYEGEPTKADLTQTVFQFIDHNRHLFHNCDIFVSPPSAGQLTYPIIIPLFEMMLMNIFSNAIKYNTSIRPRIDITFVCDHNTLRVCFHDNGIGISQNEKKKIFKKFYQGQNNERVAAGGSGIGLYLVQQIARLHHGRVVADSEGNGQGSVFTLILPIILPKRGQRETE